MSHVSAVLHSTVQLSAPLETLHILQLLGHVLIPSLSRGKGRDIQESSEVTIPVILILLTKLYDIT